MFFYSDTNPLLSWAEAQIPGADSRCKQIAVETKRIIETTGGNFSISEITLVEFHSNLFKWERDTGKPNFGSAEADLCLIQIMDWIFHGHIQVIKLAPKLIEKAMAYVRLATRNGSCPLKAWDALHLAQANEWAHSLGVVVNIVTNDNVFEKFLKSFPEFTEYVKVYDPLKKKFYP